MGILKIAVTKGGKDAVVELDTDNLPEHIYAGALAEGLKSFINKGMAKILTKGLEGSELDSAQAAASKKASENLAALLDGTFKLPGTKKAKSGVSGAVMTEAKRIARNMVKDEIKREGKVKVSHIAASEITRLAVLVIEADPSILEQAAENLAARESKAPKGKLAELLGGVIVDPKLVAAAEAKKKPSGTLSAKQAGRTKARPQQATAH